jgi:hypothetical protein
VSSCSVIGSASVSWERDAERCAAGRTGARRVRAVERSEVAQEAELGGGQLDRPASAAHQRVETDADGHAKYEAHMTNADGGRITVYVNADFEVVSVEPGR